MSRRRGPKAVARQALARLTPASGASEPAQADARRRLVVRVGSSARQDEHWDGPGCTVIDPTGLDPARASERWDQVVVAAGSLAELRGVLPWLALAGSTRRVVLDIEGTDRAHQVRVPARVAERVVVEAKLERAALDGPVRLEIRLSGPTPVGRVAAAAVSASGGRRAVPAAGLRLGVTSPEIAPWAAGDPAAVPIGGEGDLRDENGVPAADLVIGPGPATDGLEVPRLSISDALLVPPVDVAVCSPLGFGPAEDVDAVLTADEDGRWSVRDTTESVLVLNRSTRLTENHLRMLRRFRYLRLADDAGRSDIPGLCHLLAQLSCAGIPVTVPPLPVAAREVLGAELAQRLEELDPSGLVDEVGRDAWSVRTRRLALGRFESWTYWSAHADRVGLPRLPRPSVSIILPTRRPHLLSFALAQIERQDWPECELVVALHGVPASMAPVQAALRGFARPVSVVEVPAERRFGEVLNAGLSRCSGQLVTKMDDDDWYGPHHVSDLVLAHHYSGATLVGAGRYYVYLAQPDLTVRFTNRPTEAFTTWVVGATNLITTADLRAIGGWSPVPFGEDTTLYRQILADGGTIYATHDLGFTYFRGHDHTWMPEDGDTRWRNDRFLQFSGLAHPPEVDPLPHPSLTERSG